MGRIRCKIGNSWKPPQLWDTLWKAGQQFGVIAATGGAFDSLRLENTDRTFLDAMLEQHTVARRKLRAYVDHIGKQRPIHPEYVAATVDELAAHDRPRLLLPGARGGSSNRAS